MPSLRILVPVYREQLWMKNGFAQTWKWLSELPPEFSSRLELCFCVWVKDAQDEELVSDLTDFKRTLPKNLTMRIVKGASARPSVAASLMLGINGQALSAATSQAASHTLICPIDCSPTVAGIAELFGLLDREQGRLHWYVFTKRYHDPIPSVPLRFSAWTQNTIFSPWFGLHCWTHLFVIPSPMLPEVLQMSGFLEDLHLNKQATQRLGPPLRVRSPADISGRRYAAQGTLKKIWSNIYIFGAYLRGRHSPDDLRKIHES